MDVQRLKNTVYTMVEKALANAKNADKKDNQYGAQEYRIQATAYEDIRQLIIKMENEL